MTWCADFKCFWLRTSVSCGIYTGLYYELFYIAYVLPSVFPCCISLYPTDARTTLLAPLFGDAVRQCPLRVCPWCKARGCTEAEYTSHTIFVDGVLSCPRLRRDTPVAQGAPLPPPTGNNGDLPRTVV